jgi:hypothetical protein
MLGMIWSKMDGYKSYIVALGAIGYAVYMGWTGTMAWTDAECSVAGCATVADYLLGGGALASVKSALDKVGLK